MPPSTIHVGQEAKALHGQAGYTTATDAKDQPSRPTRLINREESIYGLLNEYIPPAAYEARYYQQAAVA